MRLLRLLILFIPLSASYSSVAKVNTATKKSRVALEDIKKSILSNKNKVPQKEDESRGIVKWRASVVDLTSRNQLFSFDPFIIEWDLFTKNLGILPIGYLAGLKGHVISGSSGFINDKRDSLLILGYINGDRVNVKISVSEKSHNILSLNSSKRIGISVYGRAKESIEYRAEIFNQYSSFKESSSFNLFALNLNLGYILDFKKYFNSRFDHKISFALSIKSDHVKPHIKRANNLTNNASIRASVEYKVPNLLSMFKNIRVSGDLEVSFDERMLGGGILAAVEMFFPSIGLTLDYGIHAKDLYQSLREKLIYLDLPHIYVDSVLEKEISYALFVNSSFGADYLKLLVKIMPHFSNVSTVNMVDGSDLIGVNENILSLNLSKFTFMLDFEAEIFAKYKIFNASCIYRMLYNYKSVNFRPTNEVIGRVGLDFSRWLLNISARYIGSFLVGDDIKISKSILFDIVTKLRLSNSANIEIGIINLFNSRSEIVSGLFRDNRRLFISISVNI